MKIITLMLVFFVGIANNLHSQTELLIFNSTGHVVLVRSDKNINNCAGEIFGINDIIVNTNGTVTLINRNNKRVSIKDPGEYSYNDLVNLFDHAESSMTNKYFVYVWEKMNSDEVEVNKPGGVIRGDEVGLQPLDNVVVLSDEVEFRIPNMSGNAFTLKILDENKEVIYESKIKDELLVNVLDVCDNTGKYYWEIVTSFGGRPDRRAFTIPDSETKNTLLSNYINFVDSFSIYSDYISWLLTNEYKNDENIYIYTK